LQHTLNPLNENPKKKQVKDVYPSLRFGTLSFPFLNVFHELFYSKGKKSVPQNMSEYFTEISFAY